MPMIVGIIGSLREAVDALRQAQEWMIANHPHSKMLREQLDSGELERRLNWIGPDIFDPTRCVRILLHNRSVIASYDAEYLSE